MIREFDGKYAEIVTLFALIRSHRAFYQLLESFVLTARPCGKYEIAGLDYLIARRYLYAPVAALYLYDVNPRIAAERYVLECLAGKVRF